MYGIILIDGQEVVIYFFKYNRDNRLIILNTITYDLASSDITKPAETADILAVIMSVFLSHKGIVQEWSLSSRGVSRDVVDDVSKTLGIPSEILSLQREHELICKGLAMEYMK